MTKTEAHRILDLTRAGVERPCESVINQALALTGDLVPSRVEFIGEVGSFLNRGTRVMRDEIQTTH